MGVALAGAQLRHTPELARRLIQHTGLVERDAEVAVLFDARVGDLLVGRRRFAPRPMHEAGGDQPVQRLPNLELAESRVLDDLVDVAAAVEQRKDALLRIGELRLADREAVLVELEDQVERRDLFLDQAPLVHAAGALEQQRLGVDRDQEVLPLRPDVDLEVEGSLRPGEQVVHRLLDLNAHVALQVGLRDDSHPDEALSQLLVARGGLPVDGRGELLLGDLAVLHEDIAQPVAPVDNRGVADAALVEVDVAEVRAVGDRETSRLLPEGEQLEYVGERGFLERAFDGHQRSSSMRRSATSGQSQTIFSRLLMPPRLDTTIPLVRKPLERLASRDDWPSSTSRASPAVTGTASAAAALTTRCRKPTKLRTETAGRSRRLSAAGEPGGSPWAL